MKELNEKSSIISRVVVHPKYRTIGLGSKLIKETLFCDMSEGVWLRLWSIHPKYLDRVGLVAVWREGLLAKRVLEGKIKGYRYHPQLLRFKRYQKPVDLIDAYLFQIYLEAKRRGYSFDHSKIRGVKLQGALAVTRGQLEFEFAHLLKKLEKRDKKKLEELKGLNHKNIEPNPVFRVIDGEVEQWES